MKKRKFLSVVSALLLTCGIVFISCELPTVDVNVNQPEPTPTPPTTPSTPSTPTAPTTPTTPPAYTADPELKLDVPATGYEFNQSWWDNEIWANGRERVVIDNTANPGQVVTLLGGLGPEKIFYTIPKGGTLVIQGDGELVIEDYAVLNAVNGNITIFSDANKIDNSSTNAQVILGDKTSPNTVSTPTHVISEWVLPLAPPTTDVIISNWKIDPDLLSDTHTVYVEKYATISGDVDLTGKKLTVLGTMVAESAVTNFNPDTNTIPKLDLNGKQVTISDGGANITEITSNAASALLTIPAGGFTPLINVQEGRDIRLNVAGSGSLNITDVRGAGTLVVAGLPTQVDIEGTGNVRFATTQALTFSSNSDHFKNTGLTTFEGPVLIHTAAPEFGGSTIFKGDVTLDVAVVFASDATFTKLTLSANPSFGGKTTIASLVVDPLFGNALIIGGNGDVVVNTFNRGNLTSLTKGATGSITFPWFSSVSSPSGNFTLAGDGKFTLTVKPPLGETRRLIYNGGTTSELTLQEGANINQEDTIQVTGDGHLKVPAGQNILIGANGSLNAGGMTLLAGTYYGLDINNASAIFEEGTVFRPSTVASATVPYGIFNGDVTFAAPVSFTGAGVKTFSGNVSFNEDAIIADGSMITTAKNITFNPGKAIKVGVADPVPVIRATGGKTVLTAAGATFTANAPSKLITVGIVDITLASGSLVVAKDAEFAIPTFGGKALTLKPGANLILEPGNTKLSFSGGGITLVEGSYDGPLNIINTAATFEGNVTVKAPITLPYGTFQANATFETLANVTISGAPTFEKNATFRAPLTVTNTGNPSFVGDATLNSAIFNGAATFAANANAIFNAATTFSNGSGLNVVFSGNTTFSGTAAFNNVGAVNLVTATFKEGVTFPGSGGVSFAGNAAFNKAAAFNGTGAIGFATNATFSDVVGFSGSSGVNVTGNAAFGKTATFNGTGTIVLPNAVFSDDVSFTNFGAGGVVYFTNALFSNPVVIDNGNGTVNFTAANIFGVPVTVANTGGNVNFANPTFNDVIDFSDNGVANFTGSAIFKKAVEFDKVGAVGLVNADFADAVTFTGAAGNVNFTGDALFHKTAGFAKSGGAVGFASAVFDDTVDFTGAGAVTFSANANFAEAVAFTGTAGAVTVTGNAVFNKTAQFAKTGDTITFGNADFADAVAFTGTAGNVTITSAVFNKAVEFAKTGGIISIASADFDDAVDFTGGAGSTVNFSGAVDFAEAIAFNGNTVNFSGAPIFNKPVAFNTGAVAFTGTENTFKDDITIANSFNARNITLLANKAIKVNNSGIITPVLTADGADLALTATSAPASFTAGVAPYPTIAVGAQNVTITGGQLAVSANTIFAMDTVTATLDGTTKLLLNTYAVLSGAVAAGNTRVTSWRVGNAAVTIESDKISSNTPATLTGFDSASAIVLNPTSLNTPTALEISNVDVRLAGNGSVSANSGSGYVATITLSGNARISGLIGASVPGSVSVMTGGSGPYQYATLTNLVAMTSVTGSPSEGNYLYPQGGDATLEVTTGSNSMTINNGVYATNDGEL